MNSKDRKQKRAMDRFERHVATAGSGLFTRSTREKLLGKKRIWDGKGDEATRNTFWYRTNKRVKTALKDLQLFIELADKNYVNQVVTVETLKPVVKALLYQPIHDQEVPNRKRAEIAKLFIEEGFGYLGAKSENFVTTLPTTKRTVEDALSLSSYLVESFREE
ncbi:MAG: hypothetical protein NWE77_02700 [Candidatus Bathyarchaeota archaeon]|nr:hypothetical protein [Candidatus Bathyarchaeota archaeon]